MTKTTTTKTLFAELFSKNSEVIDAHKTKYAETTLKRRFQQAYAKAEMKIHTLAGGINSIYLERDIESLDLNELINRKMESDEASKIMEHLADEYRKLFGEEIA